ncbi:hypothetical protein SLE2022_386910 [Rubroshorea leprosula]
MAVSHFSHEHPLNLVEVEEEDLECNGCGRFIAGPVYTCRDCNFNLHKSCFDLPTEVSHRFHQDHPLFLRFLDEESNCTRCSDTCVGFIYNCRECSFTLDHKCAVLTNISVQEAGQEQNSIDHFLHNHSLMFHNNFRRGKLSCLVCRLRLSGCPVYFCPDCNFFIHESCIWEIQPEIQTSFHPHSLIAFSTISDVECGSCKMNFKGIGYCCLKCGFHLNVQCADSAKQMTTLKLKRCEHNFYYFESKIDSLFMCDACNTSCIGSFYRSVRCDLNLHLECIPLPESIFKCKFHKHKPLVFKDEYVDEEYIEGHYCDFCEELRNPKESVYFCGECKSAAHIACVMEDQRMEVLSYMVPRKWSSRQLQHFIHAHPLHEEQGEDGLCCNGCSQMISGPAYGCEKCDFHVHKSCLQLPFEIRDPSHLMHPLFLTVLNRKNCQKCGYPTTGWTYHCGRCSFFIHVKCASLTMEEEEKEVHSSDTEEWEEEATEGSDKEYEQKIPRKRSSRLQHFIHAHPLYEEQVEGKLCCDGCSQMISGPAYGCEKCNFHLHKSCSELPFEIRDTWHPMHPLFLVIQSNYSQKCLKCGDTCTGCTYHCGRCSVSIHFKCASLIMEEEAKEVQRSDREDWEEGVTEGSGKEYEQKSYSEEEKIDAEKNGSDAKEPDIAQLAETILSLQDEAETLRKKIETLQAIKERLLNKSHQQS